jgi:fatty acid desaturase
MKIQRAAMAMIIVFLTFYLLYLGQTLLLPLVIAGAIAYLISILAHAIAKLAYKGFSCAQASSDVLRDRDHTLVAFLSSSAHHGQHSERDQGRP